MAERWLKVEVEKTATTDVYLRVDDADPRFAAMFAAEPLSISSDAAQAATDAAARLGYWDEEESIEVVGVNEVAEDEAKRWQRWDAVTEKRIWPSAAPTGTPERR